MNGISDVGDRADKGQFAGLYGAGFAAASLAGAGFRNRSRIKVLTRS